MTERSPDPAPSEAAAAGASTPDLDGGAADEGAFSLQLPDFEGPLDLLLHLIERDELDVTAVSLLSVTEQYMQHLRSSRQINLGALADFIAVGARLLLLKSRALLPHQDGAQPDDADSEARDLIDALREYQRYKQAAEFLRDRDRGHASYRRLAAPPRVTLPTGLDTVTLDSLAELIREVLERLPEDEPTSEVQREPVRLADRMDAVVSTLERDGRTSFRRLIGAATSRVVVIVDFLAVLELIKSHYLEARQAEAFGDIDLVRLEGATRPDVSALAAIAALDPDEDGGDAAPDRAEDTDGRAAGATPPRAGAPGAATDG